jgi:hypothetical protein
MGVFNRKVPRHYIPVHPDNVESKDWIVLLEVGTLVGRSVDMLRVAITTLERKIVTKYDVFLRKKYFLVVEGYDPRIHALFFCPQLYRLDSDHEPVALNGEEIGQTLAQSFRNGVSQKQPWYEPAESLPADPIIAAGASANADGSAVAQSAALRSAA